MIEKSQFDVTNNSISLYVPFTKIDRENRTVSGFATLDNVDAADDVVTFEASKRAFEKSIARIREMHTNNAVGKIVDFHPEDYYDPETNSMHKGIYVTAYVSKGAEDTWIKVNEEVLTGFSIGGNLNDHEIKIEKAKDGKSKPIRYITDYTLNELSLVDVPCNPLAKVLAIQKKDDGTEILKGDLANVSTENIFWCSSDEIAKTSPEDTQACSHCDRAMDNIGWVASDEDVVAKIGAAVNKVISTRNFANEGGNEVADEVETTTETEEVVDAVEVVPDEAAEVEEEKVEKAETDEAKEETEEEPAGVVTSEDTEAEETEKAVESPDFTKALAELTEAFTKSLAEAVAEIKSTLDGELEEVKKANAELAEKFDSVETNVETVEKRVENVESSTAVKKSGDLGGSKEAIAKKSDSPWNGAFLSR